MSNIFDGFSNSEINDHNADFSVSRIISESKLQGPLSEFLKDHFSSTEIKNPEDFAAAVRSAAKLSEPREQLTEFLRAYGPDLVIPWSKYIHSQSEIATSLIQELEEWTEGATPTILSRRYFPSKLTEYIRLEFFPESPFDLCKTIHKLLRRDLNTSFADTSFLYMDLLRLYGNEPFDILLDSTTASNYLSNKTVHYIIWGPLLLKSIEPDQKPTLQAYIDCLKLSCKYHNRLVQLGCFDLVEEWEATYLHVYHKNYQLNPEWVLDSPYIHPEGEDFTAALAKHLDILRWQRLCHPSFRKEKIDSRIWFELSFELEKSYCHSDCSEELVDQFIEESLRIFNWDASFLWTVPSLDKIGKSILSRTEATQVTKESPTRYIYQLWYSSPYKDQWLSALDMYIANADPSEQLKIFNYLLRNLQWEIGPIDLLEQQDQELKRSEKKLHTIQVEEEILNRWTSSLFALGKACIQKKVRLSHGELIKWLDIIDLHKERISIKREDLVPYADKALAFLRPHLYQQSKEVNLYTISSACSIMLNYTPEQFLRNLLQAFRKCPIACSGKGLEFGAGSNILANYDYPLQWWISILISNCLRLPYACLEALKPHVYQHDPQGNKLDYTGNPIEEDGFYKDGQGKNIDKNGQIVDFKKPDKITKILREEFTQFCFKSLLLKKNQKCAPNTFYDEAQCTEPDAYWRQGFIRALDEIGLDLDGEVHRRLNFVADHDPNEAVRGIAREAYQALRRKHHHKEADPVKGLLIAFWTLRLAQHKALNEDVDPQEATKTRRNELRYATNVQNVISLISY